MRIDETPVWRQLAEYRNTTADMPMTAQFAADPERFARMHETLPGLLFDYSKNRIDETTLELLCRLAETAQVREKAEAMFGGEIINTSEQRAVLHTALRLPEGHAPITVRGENVCILVQTAKKQALDFAERILNGSYRLSSGQVVTDLVHIGIGGSDLGPQTSVQALQPFHRNVRVHFVSNVDDALIAQTLAPLNPKTTLFSLASKSFGTPESLLNAETAKQWLSENGVTAADIGKHFIAITANPAAAKHFGIPCEHILPMYDWVGGRYSVWSAVGFPLMVAVGAQHFEAFLAGAYTADRHFRHTPLRHNIPVLMALIGIWYNNFYGAQSHAVIPYSHLLRRFPAHLQQLDMESNGKSATPEGGDVHHDTGAVIWGDEGINCQHAFFQLIHQGTRLIPVDFIVPMSTHYGIDKQHRFLVANAFAQAEALMRGKTLDEALAQTNPALPENERHIFAHQNVFLGNRPSNTFLLDALTPHTLGILMALYEHKVFVQGAIWGINSFDQWGVEYGKRLAKNILPELENAAPLNHDASTNGLIEYFRQHRHKNI